MRVLLMNENPDDRAIIAQTLCTAFQAVECVEVSQPDDLKTAMAQAAFDLVLIDSRVHWTDAATLLRTVRERWPHIPVVMLTDTGSETLGIEGLRAGFNDYVFKGTLQRLPMIVGVSLEQARLETERHRATEELHVRVRQQAMVAELGQRALAGTPLSTLLDETVSLVAHTLAVEYCKVLELLPAGTALRLRAGVGWQAGLVGVATVAADVNSQAGYTLLSNAPVVVHDLRTETRFNGPPLLHDHGVLSGMSVPIWGTPRPFGILGAHTTQLRVFNTHDAHFLQAVANILGQAIERQHAEDLLRQNEAKLAMLFQASPNTILLTRLSDGMCVAANEYFTRATGYATSEILGTSSLALNLWADPADRQRMVQVLRDNGEILNAETTFRTKDGTLKAALLSARVVDIDNTPHILSITQDISALKRVEVERDAEARFLQVQFEIAQTALENLQADVLLPRLLDVICRAQDYQVGLLWRLSADRGSLEVVASWGEGTAPFVGHRWTVHDQRSLATEAIHTGKPVFRNGFHASPRATHPLSYTLPLQACMALPLIAHTGEILGVLSLGDTRNPDRFTTHDVEQGTILAYQVSQAVENGTLFSQLQQLQEQYQAVTDTLHDAVYTVNLEGRIAFVNPALARLTGYQVEELLGQSSLMLHTAENIPVVLERHQAAFRGEAVPPYRQTKFVHKNGQLVDVETASTTLRLEGKIAGRVVVARDTRTRTQLEAELRQSQKMQALATLVGGIAHDFNNILGAVLGYAEITLDDVPEHSVARENLRQILVAGERARDLIQQMLTFSHQTVQEQQERQPVHLHLLIEEVLTLLRTVLPATITLRQTLAAHTGTILANPTQMHRMLLNLFTNAEHAMRDTGGVLEIDLDAVEFLPATALPHPGLTPGAYLRLRISDTGHGIEPQIIERIFEPFFTTKDIGKGTGLGLAVVHGIVTDHYGAITVESTPGQGTTFTVYLPRYDSAEAPTTQVEEAIPRGHERILLIDDEVRLAHFGQAILSRLGYDVTIYTSSPEALAAFRAAPTRFDLVIIDQVMPEMTGATLAQALRRLRADIPIILYTGFSHTMDEEKAKRLGLDAFCMKPMLSRDLGPLIRRVLELRAPKET